VGYALANDWTDPRLEKLLTVNAAMLRVYALAAKRMKRAEWNKLAHDIVAWADKHMALANGFWAASESVDAGVVDDVLYTNYNAQWIRALAFAGATLENNAWVVRAKEALDLLLETMSAPG